MDEHPATARVLPRVVAGPLEPLEVRVACRRVVARIDLRAVLRLLIVGDGDLLARAAAADFASVPSLAPMFTMPIISYLPPEPNFAPGAMSPADTEANSSGQLAAFAGCGAPVRTSEAAGAQPANTVVEAKSIHRACIIELSMFRGVEPLRRHGSQEIVARRQPE